MFFVGVMEFVGRDNVFVIKFGGVRISYGF